MQPFDRIKGVEVMTPILCEFKLVHNDQTSKVCRMSVGFSDISLKARSVFLSGLWVWPLLLLSVQILA